MASGMAKEAAPQSPPAQPEGVRDAEPTDAPRRWADVYLTQISVAGEIEPQSFREISELGEIIGGIEGQLDSAGNISFVEAGNLFVTASGAFIRTLAEDDFVKIVALRESALICEGLAAPSTEALMHWRAHEVTSADVVIHFHHIWDSLRLPRGVAVTGPHEYGSVAFAEGVAAGLSNAPIVYIRCHGFVIAGSTAKSCRAHLAGLLPVCVAPRVTTHGGPEDSSGAARAEWRGLG
jgi:hypothetical protein